MTLNISSSVTDDQLGVYYRRTAAIADRLGKSLRYEDVMVALQRIHDNEFAEPFVKVERQKSKKVKTVLKQTSTSFAYPPLTNRFDPNAFCQTCRGLWVSDDFRRLILAKAQSIERLDAAPGTYFDLVERAHDREIRAELPANHEFEISELCARIAQLILAQPEGQAGDLLNNGSWNIFYVAGFAVRVRWNSDFQEWNVDVWREDAYHWRADSRAFSRN